MPTELPSAANAVLSALFERRSIRKYTDQAISREQLTVLAEAVRWAPSGSNRQPVRLLFLPRNDPRKQTVSALSKYAEMLHASDTLALLFLDRAACYDQTKDCQVAGAAFQNTLLAAHSLGIGSVWVGEILAKEPDVMAALGLSGDAYQFMGLVALGFPAESGRAKRHDLSACLLEPF